MVDNLEAQSASNSGKTNASDTMAMALMHEVHNREADRKERRLEREREERRHEEEREREEQRREQEIEREEQRREQEREECRREREWQQEREDRKEQERRRERQDNMQTIMLMVAAFASAFNGNGTW
jgi:FtsZ-interacting cell division protein ZipA